MLIRGAAAILAFLLMISGLNAAEVYTKDQLREFFKEEESQTQPFTLLKDSLGEFNPVGGFADGRYRLENYYIEKVDRHIYILHLLFRKKKGILSFDQKVDIPFWYDGRIIVFKTRKGKFKFKIPSQEEVIIKDKNKYIIRTNEPQDLKIVLPDIRAKYYLHLIFGW